MKHVIVFKTLDVAQGYGDHVHENPTKCVKTVDDFL